MRDLSNCVAVITGAGSGIGQALAYALAERNAGLAISDINPDALERTAKQLSQSGINLHTRVLDVSNREAMFAYAESVAKHFDEINLVINNAGAGLASGLFRDTTLDEFEWLMSVNFSGVLYGCKAFLPLLEKSSWGHIVNLSSLFGLIGVAEQSAYNSSKFAVRGLTEALRNEFELINSTVSATSVHPGGVKTNIARNTRPGELLDDAAKAAIETRGDDFEKVAKTTADSAASQILKAVEKNKRRLLIGADAKLMDRIQRFFPSHYNNFFVWIAKMIAGKDGIFQTQANVDQSK